MQAPARVFPASHACCVPVQPSMARNASLQEVRSYNVVITLTSDADWKSAMKTW